MHRLMRACIGHVIRSRNIFTRAPAYAPIQVQMPALSPTMEEGTITKWLVGEGDSVEIGDALCEVETDKAVVTMEANEDGTIAKILVPEGTKNVKISVPIAILAEEGEDVQSVASMDHTSAAPAQTSIGDAQVQETTAEHENVPPVSSSQLSPAVRQTLLHHNIDSKKIAPTGPKGLILKGDVLKYISEHNVKPQSHIPEVKLTPTPVATKPDSVAKTLKQKPGESQPPQTTSGNHIDLEISNVRKVIAKRLTESKQQIPHAYSSVDCNISKILKLRKELQKEGIKLSVNDFIIKAVAQTLRQVPDVNCSWDGQAAVPVEDIDVSVAVATDGGLITPIIKNASNKGLSSIADEIRELAGRARSGKLRPNEYQGGSFTISNLGMYGIREFTAVINPPQTCIMAVGGTRLRSTLASVDLDADDDHVTADVADVESVMTVTLSSDARVVDDELASKFLEKFRRNIENPMTLGLL